MVRISYITITARDNFPTVGLTNLHLWEPTLQTLANQTFKDFEYIVVDVFYEDRPNYFKDHNYRLKIKHIPALPNLWYKHGLAQVCEQFNKGIVYADGELIFFDADSAMLHPQLMQNLWNHYQDGYFVSLGFGIDTTHTKELCERHEGSNGQFEFPTGKWQDATIDQAKKVDHNWYSFLNYNGLVIMDHRYRRLFENNGRDMEIISPDWYYGISTVSLDAILKVNGFETSFDGDPALNDVDLGNRLFMAGYSKLAMFRDSYIIKADARRRSHPKMRAILPEIKCNYALYLYNKVRGKYRANVPLGKSEIDYIINVICKSHCSIRDQCKTLPYRGPFFNKNEKELYKYWKRYGLPYGIDLKTERELRKDKQEGTWINV